MQIYKAYFKITKKHIAVLLLYFTIFVAVSYIVAAALKGSSSGADFTLTKSRIAVLNRDGESAAAKGLYSQLDGKAKIVSIADTDEAIQDALFYGSIEYVLVIPKGFSESLYRGGTVELQRTTAEQTASNVNIDLIVNRYLDLTRLYIANLQGASASEIASHVAADLEKGAQVDFRANKEQKRTVDISFYFRFMAYSLMAIIIMGVTTISLSFRESEFNKRNMCLPVSPSRISMRLFIGNIVLAVIVWAMMCLLIIAVFYKGPLNTGTALLLLNALVYTVATLGMAFLLAKIISNQVAMSAVTNIVTLGMCFISGVFVDQYLLGKTVTTIASFTPTYWYIHGVSDICSLSQYALENMQPLLYDMLIQLGFAAAFFVIAMVVAKQRKV